MKTIAQALMVAFQFCGQEMSDVVVKEMAKELSAYPEEHVLSALKRCRQELRFIKFADIVERIPGGYPGPEEAWAIVSKTLGDESVSVAWTEEMAQASAVSYSLLNDPVAARMAFKECYTKLVSEARAKQQQPKWVVSLGWDKNGREIARLEAENKNRIALSLPPLPLSSVALIESQVSE